MNERISALMDGEVDESELAQDLVDEAELGVEHVAPHQQHRERGHGVRQQDDDAVEAQIEREVIDEHQTERAAAQRVDAREARTGGRHCGRVGAHHSRCPAPCLAPIAAHRSGPRHSMRQPPPSADPIADNVRSRSARPGRRVGTHSTYELVHYVAFGSPWITPVPWTVWPPGTVTAPPSGGCWPCTGRAVAASRTA